MRDYVSLRGPGWLGALLGGLVLVALCLTAPLDPTRDPELARALAIEGGGAPGWTAGNSASVASSRQLRGVPQGARKDVRGLGSHSASTRSP